jgi:hypothetical protein
MFILMPFREGFVESCKKKELKIKVFGPGERTCIISPKV